MKIRVLHVYPQLNCGGTEMVIYNLIKFGNHDKFQYEILTQRPGDNEEVFRALGCKIHTVECIDKKQYRKSLTEFFHKEKFDVVHTHMHSEMPYVLKAASDARIECRVAHSHNARIDIPTWTWPLFYFKHHRYERYATELFGCSELALKWLFPAHWKKGCVINNGIDLSKFSFNSDVRNKIREDNGIKSSTKVFINVGRCTDQKNQDFIINLAAKRKDRAELFIIIGEGPLFNALNNKKEDLGLDNVWLLGKRDDVADWLCASDFFLFPSVYEGLGIVAIEAQAAGLKVIASEGIPPEADMHLGNFQKAPLKDTDRWHSLLNETPYTNSERQTLSENASNSDYNILTVTKKVESIYSK